MQLLKRFVLPTAAAALLALGLAGCGGNQDTVKVHVMGDSLADVGTFGYKFTVQDAGNPKGFPIWTQLTASRFGIDGQAQCPHYTFAQGSFAANKDCSNYAIGGGRIVVSAASGGSASPLTIGTQMAAAAANGGFGRHDLVLVDGGGNDAADLVGAWLAAANGAEGAAQQFQTFLGQQLDGATLQTLFTQDPSGALAAGAYMQQLAETFHGQLKSQLIDKGAQRVVVLNMPDITLTPRFAAVLAAIAQNNAAQAQAAQGAIRQWIQAFNARLTNLVAAEKRIALVDFYGTFTQQVQSPASFGLSNATDTACPATGVGNDGLPAYNFQTCTSAALDATPGKSAGWWKNYLFSDGFHPTPKAHELMADTVVTAIRRAGWM